MDRTDDEVVVVAGEMIADLGRVPRVPGDLDAEADGHAPLGPALGPVADDALALLEGGLAVAGRAGREVDVIGDRQLRDAPLDGQSGVVVEWYGAVVRQVRVDVRIQRQIARSAIDRRHLAPPGRALIPG